MDVRCPQCQTLYEIDEDRVQSNDATLKCRECQHMFRLGAGRVPSREDAQRWMVRDSPGGDILYLDQFDTLHEWIMERKIDRRWEISRTGDTWKQLGDIGEFEPIFQAVESASGVHPSQTQSEDQPQSQARAAQPDDSGPRPRANTQSQFEEASDNRQTPGQSAEIGHVSDDEPTQPDADKAAGGRSPTEQGVGDVQLETGRFDEADDQEPTEPEGDEWSFEGETTPDADRATPGDEPVEPFEDDLDYGQSRRWPYVAILLLVIGGAAAYGWYAQPPWLMTYVDKLTGTDRAAQTSSDAPTDDDKDKPAPVVEAASGVASALDAASSRADERANERVGTAITEVRALRVDALDAALEVAEKQAKREQQQKQASGTTSLLKRARDALQRGDASTARRLFQKVIDRAPGRAEALSGMGWSLTELGRSGDAVSYFERAREANPSYGDAYIGLARAQRNIGQYRQALETYQAYLSSFPNGSKASIAEYQSEQLRKQLGM